MYTSWRKNTSQGVDRMKKNSFVSFLITTYSLFAAGGQPVNPVWGPNVSVYTSATPTGTIQAEANAIFNTHGGQPDHGQFFNVGHAFLFAPGSYTGLNIQVGYYTSVLGMGATPDATEINSVNSPQGNNNPCIGGLNSFWRSAENFQTTPAELWPNTTDIGMTWAASQATPLRRLNIHGTLFLFQLTTNHQAGFTSGGFMADCTITPNVGKHAVVAGTQQQWLTRNCTLNGSAPDTKQAWSNGVWSQVFVGCNGTPAGAPPPHCSNCTKGTPSKTGCGCVNCFQCGCSATCMGNPYTVISATPKIAEKPFIVSNGTATAFSLMIPQSETNKIGASNGSAPIDEVSFSNVYVALPSTPNVENIINTQIASGNHIILTPGIYNLTNSINVNNSNIVVLGIGFPILIATEGAPCITVGNNAQGVRIGGILFQAGSKPTPSLVKWGVIGDNSNGYLYDCFTRVGRFDSTDPTFNQVDVMLQINSSNVVVDNTWLWRADHDAYVTPDNPGGLVFNGNNPCLNGVQINGENVIIYGLACEHTLNDLCVWSGNGGQCYFFQSEFPYDVTSDYEKAGWTGYRLPPSVTTHTAYGVGLYSFFRDHTVFVQSGIVANTYAGISFTTAYTRFLNGNGGINSVLNGFEGFNSNGQPNVNAAAPGPAYLCNWTGGGGINSLATRSKALRRAGE